MRTSIAKRIASRRASSGWETAELLKDLIGRVGKSVDTLQQNVDTVFDLRDRLSRAKGIPGSYSIDQVRAQLVREVSDMVREVGWLRKVWQLAEEDAKKLEQYLKTADL